MREFDFILRFALHPTDDVDLCIERLYEQGCDDALVGIGKPGYIALDFTRGAESALEAISSAIAAVKRAIPKGEFIDVGPDFVGLTDVAELLGCSRQNVRKLVIDSGHPPMPAYSGNPSIWHLADILAWLIEFKNYAVDESLLEVARASVEINTAQFWGKLNPARRKVLREVV